MFKNKQDDNSSGEVECLDALSGQCVNGKYFIGRKIGSGSFGSVFSVRDINSSTAGPSTLVLKASSKLYQMNKEI